MQTLHTIVSFLYGVSCAAITWIAIQAWLRLRRQQRDLDGIKKVLTRLFAITMSEHLRSNFDHLNEMKETLQKLVENEQYEDAKRIRALIVEQERQTMKALRSFQDEFGDDVVKMEITKVGGKPTNEEED